MKHIFLYCFITFLLFSRVSAQQDSILHLSQPLPGNDSWWEMFHDPTLLFLIDKAMLNNYDLQNAIKNIEIARSRLRIERSNFFPSLTATTQNAPSKTSMGIDYMDRYSRIGQASIEMNWELDVFGGIRNSVKAQKEYFLASQEDYRGVMVSLAAEVATAYIQLRTYQEQLEVTRNNLASQEEILRSNEARAEAGLTSQLAVAQSRGLLLQTRATIPGIEYSIYQQANLIGTLTGEYSDSLRMALLKTDSLPNVIETLVQGIPAELIRRRPDVRSAERQIDALAASVGASRADWWPKFYVTGAFGFGNEEYKHFFQERNMTWQISPSIQWTFFSGRKITENIRLAQLQLDEGINTYNQTLLTALQEIDDAIFSYNKSLQQLSADRQALEQIKLTLQYAVDLYNKGLSDYQTVLDSQRNVLNYENILVTAHSSTLLYFIQLYKALGGGYEYQVNNKY